jgi:hypothetical protein
MKRLYLLNIIFLLFSCSIDKDSSKDIAFLDDKLFSIQDIKSTKDLPDDLSKFPELDSTQKVQLIVPIMAKEMNLDTDYVVHFMTARFLAKQSLLLPTILVSVDGDDYGATFYIVLDKQNKPLSYFRASGGLCAGPDEINDSLLKICARRHSIFKEKEIRTYVLTETIQPDSLPKPSIFDSVVYWSIINVNGQIETTQKDSVRFTRLTETQ